MKYKAITSSQWQNPLQYRKNYFWLRHFYSLRALAIFNLLGLINLNKIQLKINYYQPPSYYNRTACRNIYLLIVNQ